MKSTRAIPGLVVATAIAVSIMTEVGNWVVNHVLASPETQAASVAALDTRVTKVETTQNSDTQVLVNQGNKIDYVVNAIQKIGTRLQIDVGQPPINQ